MFNQIALIDQFPGEEQPIKSLFSFMQKHAGETFNVNAFFEVDAFYSQRTLLSILSVLTQNKMLKKIVRLRLNDSDYDSILDVPLSVHSAELNTDVIVEPKDIELLFKVI